jgi:hypothetical protein
MGVRILIYTPQDSIISKPFVRRGKGFKKELLPTHSGGQNLEKSLCIKALPVISFLAYRSDPVE